MEETIVIQGDFTTEQALHWKEKLHKATHTAQSLSVDLKGVTDTDIVGVNCLITTHKIMSDKGGHLNLSFTKGGELDRWLSLTKFKDILNFNE